MYMNFKYIVVYIEEEKKVQSHDIYYKCDSWTTLYEHLRIWPPWYLTF